MVAFALCPLRTEVSKDDCGRDQEDRYRGRLWAGVQPLFHSNGIMDQMFMSPQNLYIEAPIYLELRPIGGN